MIYRNRLAFYFTICCLFTHCAYGEILSLADQALFFKAEHAIGLNDSVNSQKLMAKLEHIPPYNYLEYQKIKKEIANNQSGKSVFYTKPIDLDDISNYRKNYPDSPLSNKLLETWLETLAKQKRWDAFLKAMNTQNKGLTPTLQCHKLQAQYHTNSEAQTLKPALPLWISTHEDNAACTPLFSLLEKHDLITQDLLIQKYQLLLEKKTPNSLSLAKKLRSKMQPEYESVATLWDSWMHNPAHLRNEALVRQLTICRNKVLVSSLKQYAKINPIAASNLLEESEHFKLTALEKGEIIKQIALSLAVAHHKKASYWLSQIPDKNLDLKIQEWQIRTALREQNWKQVLYYINKLDKIPSQQPEWRYWKARALEQLEKPEFSTLYKTLANERNYYGFLAAGRIGQTINVNHKPQPYSMQTVNSMENKPAVARIKALIQLKKQAEANREWHHMVSSMNATEKAHAARLANRLHWYHLAIYTLNQSQHKDDVLVRFPFAFEKSILEHAQDHQMDSAWVFAIARQESAFNPLAKSPVGALGVMQLMPTTAASLMKKPSLNLLDPHTNIELGTSYLKRLRNEMQNPILVTAAYNAGPSRVKKWLPKESCDGEIWIESIPYEETRNYVKNVLALTCIYKTLQDTPFLLSKMMPKIEPTT